MDLRQSSLYARFMAASGWEVKKFSGTYVYLKNILGFRVAKLQRFDQEISLAKLIPFLKNNRVIFSVLEPAKGVNVRGNGHHRFYLSQSPYLPTKTLVLDLRPSEKKLQQAFSQNLKRILKSPGKTKLVVAPKEKFYHSWKQSARVWILPEKNYQRLLKAFGDKAKLFASSYQNELVSGCLILIVGNTAYYYQAWTSSRGRTLNAHHHLVWEVLKILKRQGVTKFDWDGIDDIRFKRKSWEGFSEFKRKFGGEEIIYPGSFQRWF